LPSDISHHQESPPFGRLRAGFLGKNARNGAPCPAGFPGPAAFRYTFRIVKRILSAVLLIVVVVACSALGLAEETSFRRVHVPNLKGKEIKAVLTFSDRDKAIEVHLSKGTPVTIPYGKIDKCAYEFTLGIMDEKSHWLKIEYHDQDLPKEFVLRMDGREYLHILDALKAHTGIEAEVLGNANKR